MSAQDGGRGSKGGDAASQLRMRASPTAEFSIPAQTLGKSALDHFATAMSPKMPQTSPKSLELERCDDLAVTSRTITDLLKEAPHGFGTKVGLVLCLGNACDALETLSGGFVLPQLEKEFSGVQTLMAAVFAGMLAGGCCAGHVACKYGPTKALVWMLSMESLAGFGGATAQSGFQYACWRFLSGFAVGAAVPSLFTTANELIHPPVRRNRWLNMIASSFMIGSITDATLAYLMTEILGLPWRVFYASTGFLPLLAATLARLWLPESPNFLLQKGCRSQLHRELLKLGCTGASIQESAAFVVVLDKSLETDKFLAKEDLGDVGFRDLLRGDWRRDLLRLAIVCFSIAFAWYGLATWLLEIFQQVGVKDVYLAGVAFALSGLPGCLLCISLIAWVSPLKLLNIALLSTAANSALLSVTMRGTGTKFSLSPAAAAATVCVFNSMSTGVFNVLTTVWATPFPLDLQPMAVGFLSVAMRVGSIIAQFVDGTLMHQGDGFEMVMLTAVLLALSALSTCGLRTHWSEPSTAGEHSGDG